MNELIVLDYETYYKSGTFSLSGQRKLSTLQYIKHPEFMLQSLASHNLTTGEKKFSWREADVISHTLSLNLEENIAIAHNGYFDFAIMAWNMGVVPKQMVCTMLMSMAVIGTALKRHGLKFVAAYLDCPPKKAEMLKEFDGMKFIPGDPDDPSTPAGRMKEYNMADIETGGEVFVRLQRMFPDSQWWHMDWALRQFVDSRLDLDKDLLDYTSAKLLRNERLLFSTINIPKTEFTSREKFCDLIRAAGAEPPYKHSEKTGKLTPALSKQDQAFQELQVHENPVVRKLCKIRSLAASNIMLTRSVSMGANAGLIKGQWPMHCLYSGAMATHRLSGADGAGGNPLNLPRKSELRNAIVPQAGYILYVIDESSFELRIARKLANDEYAMSLITQAGQDLYIDFADAAFGCTIEDKEDPRRQAGKIAQLSLQYGVGHKKYVASCRLAGIDMSLMTGKEQVNLFRYSRHKPISDYWKYVDGQVIPRMMRGDRGYALENAPFLTLDGTAIVLPSGLKLDYRGMKYGDDGLKFISHSNSRKSPYDRIYASKIYQHCCQTLANEIMMEKKVQVEREIGDRVCLEVYDEVAVAIPVDSDSVLQDKAARINAIMSASPSFWPELPLDAEGSWGYTYGSAK